MTPGTLDDVRALGDNLTPEQVTKMVTDAAHLIFGKPNSYVQAGVEKPLTDDARTAMAEASSKARSHGSRGGGETTNRRRSQPS